MPLHLLLTLLLFINDESIRSPQSSKCIRCTVPSLGKKITFHSSRLKARFPSCYVSFIFLASCLKQSVKRMLRAKRPADSSNPREIHFIPGDKDLPRNQREFPKPSVWKKNERDAGCGCYVRDRIHANSHASNERRNLNFRNWLCTHWPFTGAARSREPRIKSSPFLSSVFSFFFCSFLLCSFDRYNFIATRRKIHWASGYVACSHYKRPAGNQFRKIMAIPPPVTSHSWKRALISSVATFKVATLSWRSPPPSTRSGYEAISFKLTDPKLASC